MLQEGTAEQGAGRGGGCFRQASGSSSPVDSPIGPIPIGTREASLSIRE